MNNTRTLQDAATNDVTVIATICAALGLDLWSGGLQLLDAARLAPPTEASDSAEPAWCEVQGIAPYTPPCVPYPLNPALPVLIRLDCTATLDVLQSSLLLRYPPHHPLQLVVLDEQGHAHPMEQVSLAALATIPQPNAPCTLYLAPLAPFDNRRSFEGLVWVVARLLGNGGCPWDRKQTFQTLRDNLLEEAYEVLEALDTNDMPLLAEELGDLLLQPVIHSEMGRQAHVFQVEDVLEHITTKLIRRHPHVFGTYQVSSTSQVQHTWEQIKAQELTEKGRQRTSALDGVPPALPALAAAQELFKKAVRASFAWENFAGVWAKLHEELHEMTEACEQHDTNPTPATQAHLAEEWETCCLWWRALPAGTLWTPKAPCARQTLAFLAALPQWSSLHTSKR